MVYPTSIDTDSDLYLTKNQLSTVLNGSLTNVATTVPVTSTTGFPTVGVITIDSEVIKYTSTDATNFLSCTRGFDGTGATTHSNGATVKHAVTAIHHNALKDSLIAVEGQLITGMSNILNMNSHKITNLTSGTAAQDAAAFSQLKILQIGVPVFDTTTTSQTANTYIDTSLTATITPTSASNRILVVFGHQLYNGVNTGTNVIDIQLVRGAGTVVREYGAVQAGTSTGSQTGSLNGYGTFLAIDSPATTSAVTYKTQFKNGNAVSTVAINRKDAGTVAPVSWMLLIEVV